MSQSLKDILNQLSADVDQETLLRYLQGKLSATEQQEVEQQLEASAFEADAVEGLQQVTSDVRLQALLGQLQHDLQRKTARKRALKEKLRIREQPLLWLALLLLLLLVVISYLVVSRLHQG